MRQLVHNGIHVLFCIELALCTGIQMSGNYRNSFSYRARYILNLQDVKTKYHICNWCVMAACAEYEHFMSLRRQLVNNADFNIFGTFCFKGHYKNIKLKNILFIISFTFIWYSLMYIVRYNLLPHYYFTGLSTLKGNEWHSPNLHIIYINSRSLDTFGWKNIRTKAKLQVKKQSSFIEQIIYTDCIVNLF